jgi:hypothetical protein
MDQLASGGTSESVASVCRQGAARPWRVISLGLEAKLGRRDYRNSVPFYRLHLVDSEYQPGRLAHMRGLVLAWPGYRLTCGPGSDGHVWLTRNHLH